MHAVPSHCQLEFHRAMYSKQGCPPGHQCPAFQLQHNRAQVGAQNLWVGLLLKILSKRSLCVQPEALSWLRAPSTTCPLMSACLQKQRLLIFNNLLQCGILPHFVRHLLPWAYHSLQASHSKIGKSGDCLSCDAGNAQYAHSYGLKSLGRTAVVPTLEIGETSSDSTLIRGLYTFCLAKPGSMTYTMPSIVREVSAMLVDTTILRPAGPPTRAGGGAGSKMSCCCLGGRVEYSGYTFTGPTYSMHALLQLRTGCRPAKLICFSWRWPLSFLSCFAGERFSVLSCHKGASCNVLVGCHCLSRPSALAPQHQYFEHEQCGALLRMDGERRLMLGSAYRVTSLSTLLGDLLTSVLDFLLSCQEHQDVSKRLTHVNLDDCPDGSLQVIPLGLLHTPEGASASPSMLQESLFYTYDRFYLTLLSECAGPLSAYQEKASRLACP